MREIGFTGGEPFMNPDIRDAGGRAGARLSVLVLTNAMQPMLRPRVRAGLLALRDNFRERLTLRVSLDHYTKEKHEEERGPDTFDKTIEGIDWLAWAGFKVALAGRTCWGESEADARKGYAVLIKARGWLVDADDVSSLVLFPEIDARAELPEITEVLLEHSRQAAVADDVRVEPHGDKAEGADRPVVLPCTLLPYDPAFEMGATLSEAARADGGMFDRGAVKLCHPYCAGFCVLGGGSCSA